MPKVPNSEENAGKCACERCPTFLQIDCPKEKQEILYCAKGKTACDFPEKGCLCNACPIHEAYNLDGSYFCFRGIAE
jgi:methylamine---glutamate N-methyltransferase subunit C